MACSNIREFSAVDFSIVGTVCKYSFSIAKLQGCCTEEAVAKHLDKPNTYARAFFVDFSSAFNTIQAAPQAVRLLLASPKQISQVTVLLQTAGFPPGFPFILLHSFYFLPQEALQDAEKHPHCMNLPLQCFAVRMVRFCSIQ